MIRGKQGYVVSDLHYLAQRSAAEKHMHRLHEAAEQADFFVLNGDIFDFEWSILGDPGQSLRIAADWLAELAKHFPACRFYYVMGNHDNNSDFVPLLDHLDSTVDNFHWHPSHVRIGDCLFLHGDLAIDNGLRDPLHRPVQPARRLRNRAETMAYTMLCGARVHRLLIQMHGPRYCAKRIHQSLHHHHPDLARGLTDVYFGHSHKPFQDFQYRDLRFHNSGSAIRGLRHLVLPVQT
jgi:UDP-2,3-diacylglucosamine hydrolase